jgi:hypothetical protein
MAEVRRPLMRYSRPMSPLARRLRGTAYRALAQSGRAPRLAGLARVLGADLTAIRSAAAELDAAHLLVLDGHGEIEWALPFSAVSTPNRVSSGTRTWWAPCAWDALALGPLLGLDTIVETSCPDCSTALRVAVSPDETAVLPPAPAHAIAVVHFARPAAEWWVDIHET